MNVVEYVVDILIKNGVTDAFGIPGGVILDLLYAMENRKSELCPHLNYHEQASGFAASGYAQIKDGLGVAYATRGPGFTNLLTAVADAYQESIPIIVITAHAAGNNNTKIRMEYDQEIDTKRIAESICKKAYRIDKMEDCQTIIPDACLEAKRGRKGPVLLDIASDLWKKEITFDTAVSFGLDNNECLNKQEDVEGMLESMLTLSARPIILIGDGVRKSNTIENVKKISEYCNIPILSSRGSEDVFSGYKNYYGYVGSHGIRCANFILSKCDFILALGNRLSFPLGSKSFAPIFEKAKCMRVEIDEAELGRKIPNTINLCMDLKEFWEIIDYNEYPKKNEDWLNICNILKKELCECDIEYPIKKIGDWMKQINEDIPIVCDVGKNEVWISRAYIYAEIKNRILYSRSFGTLGNALPKAIGIYYAVRNPVVCFTGDQGIQMNIQELQYIAEFKLPILIVLINNQVSGMIRSHEKMKYGDIYVHTEKENGYSTPNFKKIADAYGISYTQNFEKIKKIDRPIIAEFKVSKQYDLALNLPKGNECQNMEPLMEHVKYEYLNQL